MGPAKVKRFYNPWNRLMNRQIIHKHISFFQFITFKHISKHKHPQNLILYIHNPISFRTRAFWFPSTTTIRCLPAYRAKFGFVWCLWSAYLPTTGENHDLYRRLGGDLSPKTLHLGTRAFTGGLMLIMHTADVIFIHCKTEMSIGILRYNYARNEKHIYMFPFSTAILMLQNKGPWVTLLTYITTIANFDCIYAPTFLLYL